MVTPEQNSERFKRWCRRHPQRYKAHLRRNRLRKLLKRAKDPNYGQVTAAYMRRWRAAKKLESKSGS